MSGILRFMIFSAIILSLFLPSVMTKSQSKRTIDTLLSSRKKHCSSNRWSKECILGKLHKSFSVFDTFHYLLSGSRRNKGNEEKGEGRGLLPTPSTAPATTDQMSAFHHMSPVTPPEPTPSERELMTMKRNLLRLENDPCGMSYTNKLQSEWWTSPGEYPWLAVLLYESKDMPHPQLQNLCGGTLINDRYVLTSAYCLSMPKFELDYVRLGEFNVEYFEKDCKDLEENIFDIIAFEACSTIPPIDYDYSEIILHPKYVYHDDVICGTHDIGLIRLAQRVIFTDQIHPVCLPVGSMKSLWNPDNIGANFSVVGWGMMNDSRPKDICRKNSLSPNCLNEKVKKPVNVFNTISFFFGNKKKKKGREKGISTSPSTLKDHHPDPLKDKRVMKNIQYLENEACGIALVDRILGGENTMPGEFPWLARLQYKDKINGHKVYACGGSLITTKYVLTAAHCLKHHVLKLQSVRLGEYNTRMYAMDCPKNGIMTNNFNEMDTCEPARDYIIKDYMAHKDFKFGGLLEHDIGLIRLQKSVQYTRYIQPICLPIGRYKLNFNYGSDLMAAGWGMTETSEGREIPLKARTPWMHMDVCRNLTGKDLKPAQLCVGGGDGGSTCYGDSGGPLVLKTVFLENDNSVEDFLHNTYERTILVGIISGGTRTCSIKPTVSTNVESYAQWILTNIKTEH